MTAMGTLIAALAQGGPVTYLIAGLFLAGMAIAVERVLAIESAAKAGSPGLLDEVEAKAERDEIAAALELCKHERALLPLALGEVLSEASYPGRPIEADRLRERVEHLLSLRAAELERRVDLLPTLGNTATMLGLLGTVFGLMNAFGPAGAAGLGPAISRALATTGLGLAAAIPLHVAQSYLRARLDAAVGVAGSAGDHLAATLVRRVEGEERARKALEKQRERAPRPPAPQKEEPASREKEVAHRHGSMIAR